MDRPNDERALKYRKRPVVVEAMKYTGANLEALLAWGGTDEDQDTYLWANHVNTAHELVVCTLEGRMLCPVGHYVVRGIQGELYPCDPEVFLATHERVPEGTYPHEHYRDHHAAGLCSCPRPGEGSA